MYDYELKRVIINEQERWKLKCPKCGVYILINNDQFCGEAPIQCECGYFHEILDFSIEKGL